MATGKQHALATKKVIRWVSIACIPAILLGYMQCLSIVIGLGCAHFFTPDMDIQRKTYTERILIRQFGIAGWLLYLYWWPYGFLFSHRGISHHLLWGTLSRFLYFFLPGYLLYIGITVRGNSAVSLFLPTGILETLLLGLLGWWVGDCVHLRLDGLLGARRD